MRELLVLHGLLKARRFLPEETLPCWELGTLEERVLEDAFNTTKCLDHISAIVI